VTYSIVARDQATGELGVAVQSHYFSVGTVVPWAIAGVGAVATQSMADITYGPLALELLQAGRSPEEALRGLTAADPGAPTRQVAIVDGAGRVATHTGRSCIAEAGHRQGDGYSVQANMMERATVWDAMAEAFEASTGDLAHRLLDALDAAEREGGDIRGRQSAALVVVGAELTPRPWERRVDVRVDDGPDPLGELRRLVGVRQAYSSGRPSDALGDNPELTFWEALRLGADDEAEARRRLDAVYEKDERWRELVRRLPAAGLLPVDGELARRLTD